MFFNNKSSESWFVQFSLTPLYQTKKYMKISQFIKETRAEAKHINWPTRKTTIVSTVAVVVSVFIIGYYLGLFDFIFSYLLNIIL